MREQVTGLLESVQALLGLALSGVYLHGSLAYGCFNPERSDIDLLILTERTLVPDTKLGLVKSFLRRSNVPAPLELSVITRSERAPWQYPTPYQLHYSDAWRERLTTETTSRVGGERPLVKGYRGMRQRFRRAPSVPPNDCCPHRANRFYCVVAAPAAGTCSDARGRR